MELSCEHSKEGLFNQYNHNKKGNKHISTMTSSFQGLRTNRGVRSFGIEVVREVLLLFKQTCDPFPVVSVGSGNGCVESLVPGIICVDPVPDSYLGPPIYQQPDYDTVRDLLIAKPEIKGNCVLFLNWCDPDDSTYDFDAVVALQPIAVLCIIETFVGENGCAGGERFHKWLQISNRIHHCYQAHLTPNTQDNHKPPRITIKWVQAKNNNIVPDCTSLPMAVENKLLHSQCCVM